MVDENLCKLRAMQGRQQNLKLEYMEIDFKTLSMLSES